MVEEVDERGKLVLQALGVRLLLAPFFFHVWDINAIQEALNKFINGINIYSYVTNLSSHLSQVTGLQIHYEGFAYLPHILYILSPFYLLYEALGFNQLPIQGITTPFYMLTLHLEPSIFAFLLAIKLPIILADVGVVLALYSYGDKKLARFYAFDPYVIFITAVWGAFDALVGLSLLYSLIMLRKNKHFIAGLSYGLSLMKFYSALAFIPLFMESLKKGSRNALSFIIGLLASQIPTLYFLIISPNAFLNSTLFFHGSRVGEGLTPLNVLSSLQDLNFSTAVSLLSSLVAITAWFFVTRKAVRGELPVEDGVVLSIMAGLFMGKIVHEQYLLGIYPLMLLNGRYAAKRLSQIILAFAAVDTGLIYFMTPIVKILSSSVWDWMLSIYRTTLWRTTILGYFLSVTRLLLMFVLGTVFFLNVVEIITSKVFSKDIYLGGMKRSQTD